MPKTNYINIKIGGRSVDLSSIEDLGIQIDFELENSEDFQQKGSAQSLDIVLPATVENDRVFGSFYDANIEGGVGSNAMDCLIEANGMELFKGKALLTSGTRIHNSPKNYKVDAFGNNGDWKIALQDKTLHDFVSAHTHAFNQASVFTSWYNFNGNSEVLDYCYAPVRYKKPFGNVVTVMDLRPSISIYWIIWRAFKSLGYKIDSGFMDSEYFRKLVMPWTWGDFLIMDSSKLDPLKFKATGLSTLPNNGGTGYYETNFFSGNGDYVVGTGTSGTGSTVHNSFEMSNDVPPLGYDNGGNYSYLNGTGIMRYVFNAATASLLGVTDIVFNFRVNTRLVRNSNVGSSGAMGLYVDWSVAGGNGGSGSVNIADSVVMSMPNGVEGVPVQYIDVEVTIPNVVPGSIISMVLIAKRTGNTSVNNAEAAVYSRNSEVDPISGNQVLDSVLEIARFQKTIGSIVDFKLFDEFKNYDFLDLLRGVVDLFDLSIQTDSINKVVKIEPTHSYYKGLNPLIQSQGYYTSNKLDWTAKVDVSKESELESYRDIEQELAFVFREDANDGGVKIYNERYSAKAGSSKFVFPNRFKSGKKDFENRFFSPTTHINMEEWRKFSNNQSVAPQIVVLMPDNISNTSADATEYKFLPKIAFCRGVNLSGVVFNNGKFNFQGGIYYVPEMFSVNYNPGGENDPVLTYGDQKINNAHVHGLMRRFFLPRLAIMRYGKRLNEWVRLNNVDVANIYHREQIILNGSIYYLVNINGYQPLSDTSTECLLWKYFPVTSGDFNSCFPSTSSVMNGVQTGGTDLGYNPVLLLQSDIPQ